MHHKDVCWHILVGTIKENDLVPVLSPESRQVTDNVSLRIVVPVTFVKQHSNAPV
jgi:hypothetical protein